MGGGGGGGVNLVISPGRVVTLNCCQCAEVGLECFSLHPSRL